MQSKINGHDVYFGDVVWHSVVDGDDWRSIIQDSHDDGAPSKASLCKLKSGSAVGSVRGKASGIPFGAIFAAWCADQGLPYVMYVSPEHVIAIVDGVPRIERYFPSDVEQSMSASEFAANIMEVSFHSGCLVYGENDLSASTSLTVDDVVSAAYDSAKKSGFSFKQAKSDAVPIAVILLIIIACAGYYYNDVATKKEKARLAALAVSSVKEAVDPKVSYLALENDALVAITPKLCDGRRFAKYATVAMARTSTNANGWQWQKTDITCDSVTSTYLRVNGTNSSLKDYISREKYLVADFSPDMITASIKMDLPQIKESLLKSDYSVANAAIPSSDFFFADGSQMQIISDNVSVKFTIAVATAIVQGDIPSGAMAIKKSSFTATGDAQYWQAISKRFFEKEHFLTSSMTVAPESGKEAAIKFKMEGMYLVY